MLILLEGSATIIITDDNTIGDSDGATATVIAEFAGSIVDIGLVVGWREGVDFSLRSNAIMLGAC